MNENNINGAIPGNNFKPLQINTQAIGQFNMNNVLAGVQNYMNLNYMANHMTGLETKWFRAAPDLKNKDVIFQEYTLSNVDSVPMCVKVVVPNGTFPDSKYSYDLMGLEYEVPLEIQIDIRYWKEIAGSNVMPQRGDIVYFTLNNKLYEVNSSYEFRGFMEQVTAYKCSLVKYQNKASRKLGDELNDVLNQITVSEESLFGEEIRNDIEKLVDTKETSAYVNSSRCTDKKLDQNLKVQLGKILIGSTLINDVAYDLKTSKNEKAIQYLSEFNFNDVSNYAFSFWFSPIKKREKTYNVLDIQRVDNFTYNIKLDNAQNINIGDFINIYRDGAITFICKVKAMNDGLYSCVIDKSILLYLQDIKSDWYTLKGLKCNTTNINLITGNNIKISLYNNRYIYTKFGDNENITLLPDYIEDKWYGCCVNISNEVKKLSHNLWAYNEIWELDNTQQPLKCIAENVFDINASQFNETELYINKSSAKITNIRLYENLLVNTKQQVHELCSRKSKNADQAIILDDATIINTLDYINKPR